MTEQGNDQFASIREWISRAAKILEDAKPNTAEEWEEAYDELLKRYRALHEAAEFAWSVALPPGACRPIAEDEDGTYRMMISRAALDKLHDELWRD